ncbi:Tetratricopeptide-like helical domain containing protein, partial [Quillaja saponaria]
KTQLYLILVFKYCSILSHEHFIVRHINPHIHNLKLTKRLIFPIIYLMESAIRLLYIPMNAIPLQVSSTREAARATGMQFRFSQTSLCLSYRSKRDPVMHALGPVSCMSNKFIMPSHHDKVDNKMVKGMAGMSLVLVCVIGVVSFNCKMNSTAFADPMRNLQNESTFPSVAGGGKSPRESFLGMKEYLASKPDRTKMDPPNLPFRPSGDDIEVLKKYALWLTKSGEAEKAVKLLEDEYNKYNDYPETAYFLDMALVEILTCQGKYDEALKRDCLQQEDEIGPSDPRLKFYKDFLHDPKYVKGESKGVKGESKDVKGKSTKWWK